MDDRDKMLDVTLTQIEKQFGKGAIMKLGEHPMGAGIAGIPTGSLSLDIALGGRASRAAAWSRSSGRSSGKTTLACTSSPRRRTQGGIAAFIDAEHALDPTWAKKLGVQLETLLVSQPGTGEEALQITEMLIQSNAVDVIVIDSVAALVPRGRTRRRDRRHPRRPAGPADEPGDAEAHRRDLAESKTSVIFINQIREKIGVMFGNPETTPGGRALKFYSSCRIDVRRIENLKEGTRWSGSRARVKVVKNKVAPPFRVRVRHDVRRRHLQGREPPRRRRRPRDRQEERARGSRTRAISSGRAARTRASSWPSTRTSRQSSNAGCARRSA